MGAGNVTVTVTYSAVAPDKLPGDVDCNGVVDFADISLLSLYLSGESEITAQGEINADFDEDGVIGFSDVTQIYLFIIGG